jgi:glycosyltransferase involved in cell wall biosynthesis
VNPRIKVLHFISNAGRTPYFSALAEHANHADFDVRMASLSPAGGLQNDMRERGLKTFALDCVERKQYGKGILRLAALLRSERIDIVQTHLFDASLVGLAAARLAKTPLAIFTAHHSHEIPLYGSLKLLWADRFASRWLSHYVIAHSEQMKEILVQKEGVPAERIAVIPLGFDLTRWRPSTEGRERVRAELGLNGKIIFGAVGRMYWIKNYPSLFQAFASLARRVPEVLLLVIGEGQDLEQLKELVKALSMEGRIIFAGHRRDIVDVLSAVDVFVHPALAESFGQVIVEALAMGKPVLSTDVGVSHEVVENGVNGFLVSGEPGALEIGLEKMLLARDRWDEMGRDGQKRIQPFAAEKMVPAFEAQYRTWLQQRGKLNGKSN